MLAIREAISYNTSTVVWGIFAWISHVVLQIGCQLIIFSPNTVAFLFFRLMVTQTGVAVQKREIGFF